jgi:hypothetical protein
MNSLPQEAPQKQCRICKVFFPATAEYFWQNHRRGRIDLSASCKACALAKRHPNGYKRFRRNAHEPEGYKGCSGCNQVLPFEAFSLDKKAKTGRQVYCRECLSKKRVIQMTPERRRKKALNRYNVTPEQYEQMLADQHYVCAVCGQPEHRINPYSKQVAPLAVDHDHNSGEVRALLCHDCNTGLGNLHEDPDRIMALYKYILYFKAR